jgi:two-component system chemotaxis response regulator CheY
MQNTSLIIDDKNFPLGITFLLLEDMENLRSQMISDLRSLGITGIIHEAADVQSAIKICVAEEIGFVISDWNLPDGTGHDFLKKFRAVLRYKKTPFVMCTTNSETRYFLNAIASGANDYIVKPWTVEDVKKKLQLTWNNYLAKNQI